MIILRLIIILICLLTWFIWLPIYICWHGLTNDASQDYTGTV